MSKTKQSNNLRIANEQLSIQNEDQAVQLVIANKCNETIVPGIKTI